MTEYLDRIESIEAAVWGAAARKGGDSNIRSNGSDPFSQVDPDEVAEAPPVVEGDDEGSDKEGSPTGQVKGSAGDDADHDASDDERQSRGVKRNRVESADMVAAVPQKGAGVLSKISNVENQVGF